MNTMSTLSVPLNAELEKHVEQLVAMGYGTNKADVVRKAIQSTAEEQAVQAILKASQEPRITGDLRTLTKKIV